VTRADKPTSFRLPPEMKAELTAAANEQAVTFHNYVLTILNDWLSKRLASKTKPDEGILK